MLILTMLKEIKSFVYLTRYYWRFIKEFTIITRLLMKLQLKKTCLNLKKIPGDRSKFKLSEKAKIAVTMLKKAIKKMPVVCYLIF